MTLTYKALSALLAYPSPDLVAALPEIGALVEREPKLPRARKDALHALAAWIAESDPIDAQEAYVALFDRGRTTSLHLFEHVHGDSRDRGQAMVDLKGIYERAGFVLAGGELPDYLPALLEYLSQRPAAEAKDMLGDCAHILRAVGEALQQRDSGYSAVFAALLALNGEPGLAAKRKEAAAPKEKPIDDEWVEEPVIFGPAGGAGCASACGTPLPQQSTVQFTPRRPAPPGMTR